MRTHPADTAGRRGYPVALRPPGDVLEHGADDLAVLVEGALGHRLESHALEPALDLLGGDGSRLCLLRRLRCRLSAELIATATAQRWGHC
ncbi:MAG TPA: hypothetical protein VGV10_00095 [Thermoleophilaceae bacterium]|nr:hypothetical protein [Thermoleophilaceae bacterium]